MDMGHYHPTESIADKISAVLPSTHSLLLHVSRPVRWDSDHIGLFNDELRDVTHELARGVQVGAMSWSDVCIALDFFDASVNRIGAWALGTRSTLKALLYALLEPIARLREAESNGQLYRRLAVYEWQKTLPFGAVWDYFCYQAGVPLEGECIDRVEAYEREVLSMRD